MPRKSSSEKEGITIQSIQRGIDILAVLAESTVPLKAVEISQQTGIHPTTIYGILNTLEQRHMVEKDSQNTAYSLGTETLRFGLAYQRNSPVVRAAQRVANQSVGNTNTSIRLAVLDGVGDLLSLSLVPQQGGPRLGYLLYNSQPSIPVLGSSSGKILLAYAGEETFRRIVARNDLTITQETGEMLAGIREQGYATDYNESMLGIGCIAAPIFGRSREIVAAVSHTGDTAYVREHEKELILHIKQVAAVISLDLGFK